MYTLDTNPIIYYVNKDPKVTETIEDILASAATVYVSVITENELLSYPKLSDEEADEIDNLLRTVSLIPLDSRLARLAATIRRTYRLKLGDGVIAATALSTGSTLLTRNTRDFKKVPNLTVQRI